MTRIVEVTIRLVGVAIALVALFFVLCVSVDNRESRITGVSTWNTLRHIQVNLGFILDFHRSELRKRWGNSPKICERDVQEWIENSFHSFPGLSDIRLNDVSNTDDWGNTYRCRAFVNDSDLRIEFFSDGRDGVSLSRGEDEDDIASWRPLSDFYIRILNRKNGVKLFVVLGVLAGLSVIGIRWAFRHSD